MTSYRFRDCSGGGGVVGSVEVPTTEGTIAVAAVGRDKIAALGKAAELAERIATDPVLSVLIPPGALASVRVARRLATAARRGPRALRALWSRLRGPGKERLASTLMPASVVRDQVAELGDLGLLITPKQLERLRADAERKQRTRSHRGSHRGRQPVRRRRVPSRVPLQYPSAEAEYDDADDEGADDESW